MLHCVTPHTCKESSVECGRYMKGALLHRLGSGISSWPGHKLEAKSQPHFIWPPPPLQWWQQWLAPTAVMMPCIVFTPLPFPSLNASNTTLCIMLIQLYIWMLLRHQTWKLLLTGSGYIDTPNAMKHQIFGFYAANPCSVPCITSHNILSHLRFPAAGEGFGPWYENVLPPFSRLSEKCPLFLNQSRKCSQ